MTAFRTWAPNAREVGLVLGRPDARPLAMTPGDRGWWTLDVPDAGPDTDYGFVLDGDGPFPDPRSSFQPHGVHGLSRVVDHDAFAWTDAGWRPPDLETGVLYELHVGTFSEAGTFEGAIEHLDHLRDLGVTHVELMPVVEFPGDRGWGYDGVALYAPHRAYGGPDGLRRLVDACHARGLAVVLDVVYNHLGPDGNHLPRFGPYFSPRYRTPWGHAFNLDGPGSDEVRAFLVDNGLHWLRSYHVDGLRLDAVHEIFDQSAVHLLEELATTCHAVAADLERRFVVIAESDLNNPRLVEPVERGGYGLDAHWNDDLRHALHTALTGEHDGFHAQYGGLPDLATALAETYVFAGRYSPFRDRRHGRSARDVATTRFVAFLQNHDQAGNRAFGERSTHLMDDRRLRIGAAVVLLGPFVPLLFAGEEWGTTAPFCYFTDHESPELAEAVRRGRREEFAAFLPPTGDIPDPQDPATFEASKLPWAELDEPRHAALLAWHRALAAFRRAHPELADGVPPLVVRPTTDTLLVRKGRVLLAVNLGEVEVALPLDGVVLAGEDVRVALDSAHDPAAEATTGAADAPGAASGTTEAGTLFVAPLAAVASEVGPADRA